MKHSKSKKIIKKSFQTDGEPEKTVSQYCVYDKAHKDYLYTPAWVDFLADELSDPAKYQQIIGKRASSD